MRSPVKGEVYFAIDDVTKNRPYLIVSRASVNGGNVALVAPFTTQKIADRKHRPQYVHFNEGESDLPKECVLQLDKITSILIRELAISNGPHATISAEKLVLVDAAIKYVFDLAY